MTNFQQRLFALQDLSYRDFQAKLIPTVDPETVIGIRTPALRKLARELAKGEDVQSFLDGLPHQYYDENNLHGFLLSLVKDCEETVAGLEAFLPYVDNWATCDLISPKAFRRHPNQLPEQARRWMASQHTYTVRFGIAVLMEFYLDGAFQTEYLDWAADLRSGEYYVNMMIAWYFATALAKQYDAALPYLLNRRLDSWTHNRAIQKALESRRVPEEQKAYLRGLKMRGES